MIVVVLLLLLFVVLIVRRRRKATREGVVSPSPEFNTVYAYNDPAFGGEMGQSNGHHRNSKQSSLYASVHGSLRHSVPFPNPHVMDLSVIPQATGTYERPVASNCLEYERPVASNCYEYERPIPSMNTTAIENSYEVPKRLRPSQGVQPSMDEGVEPQMYEMSVPLPKVQVTVEVTVEEASPYENPAHKPPSGAHKEDLDSSQGSSDEDTAFIRSIDLNNSNDSYWRSSVHCEELRKKVSVMCHEIPRQDIQITTHLGSGEFGVVNKGVWHSAEGKVQVAVKLAPPTSSTIAQVKLMQEAAMFAQFRGHPNVVQLYGVCTMGAPLMIVQEFLSKGDLLHLLLSLKSSSEGGLPSNTPRVFLSFCQHIASGMEYLSSSGFVHRDLAARNIMVSEDMVCKVGDFGMSKDLDEGDHYISRKGKIPFKWTAPEAIISKTYSSMSDVWSYGVLLYEIWSMGRKPYERLKASSALMGYLEKGGRLPPPPGCPRAIYQLMVLCWHPEKISRPSFTRIVEVLGSPASFLLHWSEEDARLHPQAMELGGPLVAGEGLYLDIQHRYRSSVK
ncbi:hypothetical protein EMCRGX_G017527 [Ephydatia muelleri]